MRNEKTTSLLMQSVLVIAITITTLLLPAVKCACEDLGTFYQIGDPDGSGIMPVFPAEDPRRVAPIHDIITPHVPLAVPLVNDPVKVLAIANEEYGRWPLEIKQRLDVDLSVVYTRSSTEFGFHSGSIGMGSEDIAARLLQALDRKPDVIVSEFKFELFPETVQKKILALMDSGVGYIGYLDKMNKEGYDQRLDIQRSIFASSVPFAGLRSLTGDYETLEKASEKAFGLYEDQHGHRLASVWSYPRDNASPDNSWLIFNWMPRMEEEAWNSFLCKVVLWCARRSGNELKVEAWKGTMKRGSRPSSLTIRIENPRKNSHLELVVFDRDARERHKISVAIKGKRTNLRLPLLAAGKYFVLVRLHEDQFVRDWWLQSLQITNTTQIAEVKTESRIVEHEGEVKASIKLSSSPRAGSKLIMETMDNFGRIVYRRTVPAAETLEVSLPTTGSLHLYNYVNVKLCDVANNVMHENRTSFIIRQPDFPVDDLVVKMWAALPGGRNWHKAWKNTLDGVDVDLNTPELTSPYNMRAETRAANVSSTSLISQTEAVGVSVVSVKEVASRLGAYPLYHYVLGDDFSMGENWTPAALEYLADWLKRRYGDISLLNSAWGTEYSDFSKVQPILHTKAAARAEAAGKPDYSGFCHWVDLQLAREDLLTDFIKKLKESIREVDPRTPLAIQNTINYPRPGAGFNYWKMAEVFDNVGTYWHQITHDVYRSARAKGSRHSIYTGSYGVYSYEPYYAMEMCPWWSVFNNINTLNYWIGTPYSYFPGVLAPDIGPLYGYKKSLAGMQELKAGTAKMLFNAQRQNDGIAVLYSQGSINASQALITRPLPRPKQWNGVEPWSGGDDHVYMNTWEGFTNLLKDIGLNYDVVSDELVADGYLVRNNFKMLVLPLTLRVTDGMAQGIRDFVRNGGVVLADFAPGMFNGRMRPDSPGVLADVFGIEYAGGLPVMGLEEVNLVENAGVKLGQYTNLSLEVKSPLGAYLSASNVTSTGATALANNSKRTPSLIINEYGKGKAVLFNMMARDYQIWRVLGEEMPFRQSVAAILKWAGMTPLVQCQVNAGSLGIRPLQDTEKVRFVDGKIEYVGILRDFALRPDERIVMSDMRAHPTKINFGREAHIYDVREGVYRGYRREIDDTVFPARAILYALLPYRVERLEAQAAYINETGKLDLTARLVTADGSVPGRHTIRVEVTDPSGRLRREYNRNCLINDGVLKLPLLLGYDPSPGVWKVELRDVASGATSIKRFIVGN